MNVNDVIEITEGKYKGFQGVINFTLAQNSPKPYCVKVMGYFNNIFVTAYFSASEDELKKIDKIDEKIKERDKVKLPWFSQEPEKVEPPPVFFACIS